MTKDVLLLLPVRADSPHKSQPLFITATSKRKSSVPARTVLGPRSVAASPHTHQVRLSRETVPQRLNSLRTISQPLLINPNIARALLQHFSQSQTQGLPYLCHLQTDIEALPTRHCRLTRRARLQTPSTQACIGFILTKMQRN